MKKLMFSLAALAALVSCSQKTVETPSLFREVSIVANSTQTKTQLSTNAVVWEEGDDIALKFTKNSTPVTVHVENFETSQSGPNVTFNGTLPNTVSVDAGYEKIGYAVYPATAMANDGTVTFTVNANPTAGTSFATDANLSSAKVSLEELDESGSTEANFLNALSIIRFTVDPDVATLTLTADKPLAGSAALTFDSDGRLEVSSFNTEGKTLTVAAPAGGFEEGTTYNVLVYPGEFATLTAEMTDTDGCTYSKTNNTIAFEASKFYTFSFQNPDNFTKDYSFAATGRTFVADDEVQVVVDGYVNETLTYAAEKFAGKTTHAAYEADQAGYALYPASAYNAGNISCVLPADGTKSATELYAAPFSLQDETVAFASVTASLGTVSFVVPEGVASVAIVSDKGIVGTAEMTVGTDGKFTAANANGKNVSVTGGTSYEFYVYPVTGASLTVTLTDGAGQTVTLDPISLTVAAGGSKTLDLSGDLNFDKNGNFTHEGFGSGTDTPIEF